MINKNQVKSKGVKIVDSDKSLTEATSEIIEKLKVLLPNVINSDNQLDIKSLSDVLDIANTTSNNQGYELTFAGKGIARAETDIPTTLELKVETAQSKDFDETNNVIIRGDNLDVLKIIRQNYFNKIKMIYIDPPYNTKSENFVYSDNFRKDKKNLIEDFGLNEDTISFLQSIYGTSSQSGWLTFMYPRLKLARDLLTDDGVILVQIDFNESHSLKLIMDEIFGHNNFKEEIIWEYRTGGMPIKNNCFGKKHDTIFAYSKISANYAFDNKSFKERNNFDKDFFGCKIDKDGNYYTVVNIRDVIGGDMNILENGENVKIDLKPLINMSEDGDYHAVVNIGDVIGGDMNILENGEDVKINLKPLINLAGERIDGFDSQKPSSLIKFLAKFYLTKNDIILDFFAGSGTTGDAAMQLNAEDGGNRKFILVQWDEEVNENKTDALKFCADNGIEPVISSIAIERLNRAGERIKEKKKVPELDIGYKVFSTTPKPQINAENNGDLLLNINNPRDDVMNTLYNMLIATCKPLDTPIVELKKDVMYQADNELYIIANIDYETLSENSGKKINLDGWADIDLEQFLNLNIANQDNISVIY